MALWWAVLTVLTLSAPTIVRADPYADLEAFVVSNGGSLNTTIGFNAKGVRGLFAKQDAKKNDLLATIPSSCMLNAGSLDSSIATGTIIALRELYDPHSRFKPWINVLPRRGEVVNLCNVDKKYLHLLDSEYWQRQINNTQNYLEAVINGSANHELEMTIKEAVGSARVTLEDLQWACAVASTRYVTVELRRRLVILPIFDMENHIRTCPHTTTALDGGDSISIIAGKDVVKGEELCYAYSDTMRDDYCVVNYGFLPEIEEPARLFTIDHPQFNPDVDSQSEFTEELFDGTTSELSEEIKRLESISDRLASLDAVRPPGPKPGVDKVYDLYASLAQRRRQVLKLETQRLKAKLSALTGEAEL